MISPTLPEMACKRIQIAKQTTHRATLPTMTCRSVHLLLLVNTERARTHVDQQEEPAPMGIISMERTLRDSGKTYTMERIWKKSYLAKSLCG